MSTCPVPTELEIQARMLETIAQLIRHGYAVLRFDGDGPLIEFTPLGHQRANRMLGLPADATPEQMVESATRYFRRRGNGE